MSQYNRCHTDVDNSFTSFLPPTNLQEHHSGALKPVFQGYPKHETYQIHHWNQHANPIPPRLHPANVNQKLPVHVDNNLPRSLRQTPVHVRNRPASNSTFVVSTPVYQKEPVFADRLIHQNNHSKLRSCYTGKGQSTTSPTIDTDNLKLGWGSVSSTQSNEFGKETSENVSSSSSGVDHWNNSGGTDRTTSESLNSRRGGQRILNQHAR